MSTNKPDHSGLSYVGGCPDEFDTSAVYKQGGTIEVNGIVLKCKPWPNSLYCSLSGFEPLGQYSDMAWTTMGYCNGTIASSDVFPSIKGIEGACPSEYGSNAKYQSKDLVSVEVPKTPEKRMVYECKVIPLFGAIFLSCILNV